MTDIITYPNPILTTPCEKFDFSNPPVEPYALAKLLLEACSESKGVGLAANQIGIPYRVFAILGTESFVMFNPKIVYMNDEKTNLEESCMSVPGVAVKVKRSTNLRVRFQTPSGGTDTKTFNGMSAKIIQHEMDHLDGIMFFNRANRYHRDKGMKGYYK